MRTETYKIRLLFISTAAMSTMKTGYKVFWQCMLSFGQVLILLGPFIQSCHYPFNLLLFFFVLVGGMGKGVGGGWTEGGE